MQGLGRAGIRAVRHRLGSAQRARRSLSLRLWRGDRAQSRRRWPPRSTTDWQDPAGIAQQWANPGAGQSALQDGPGGDDRAVRRLRPWPGDGARRAPRTGSSATSPTTTSRSRRSSGARAARSSRSRPTSPECERCSTFPVLPGCCRPSPNGSRSRSASSSTPRRRCSTEAPGRSLEVLEDQDKRQALAVTRLITSHLSELFGVTLAGELGLSAGFSSLDGD